MIYNHGKTVRQIATDYRAPNIVADEGYSFGKHEWILEFQATDERYWELEFV